MTDLGPSKSGRAGFNFVHIRCLYRPVTRGLFDQGTRCGLGGKFWVWQLVLSQSGRPDLLQIPSLASTQVLGGKLLFVHFDASSSPFMLRCLRFFLDMMLTDKCDQCCMHIIHCIMICNISYYT